MRRGLSAEHGLTIVEVTIILIVTLAIVGALAPSLSAVIRRAESVAATTDMDTIDAAITRVLNDMNFQYLTSDGVKNSVNRVNLIVSDGDTPLDISETGSATWQQAVNDTTVDFLERHLVRDLPGGDPLNAYNPPGSGEWRGAYLNGPPDPDPWGNRYMVNVQYLGASNNDVVVYSAGPDEEIDTLFTAGALSAGDDDLIVLQES